MRWGIKKNDSFFERKIKLVCRQYFGFVPTKLEYYHEALMHRSAIGRNDLSSKSNERLEFLGDSFLGAFTAAYLFDRFPDADEGELTKLRSKIVSRTNLNKLAIELHIHVLVKRSLHPDQAANTIYGNALEAFIGAIYLERGAPALFLILKNIFAKHIDLTSLEQTETDYKSRLFEFAQKERKSVKFVLKREEMLHNRKYYTLDLFYDNQIVSEGRGHSKKKAEQDAAKNALLSMQANGYYSPGN